jgi:hypothetical protein
MAKDMLLTGFFQKAENFLFVHFSSLLFLSQTSLTLPRRCEKIDLVLYDVIPAKAGIQSFHGITN